MNCYIKMMIVFIGFNAATGTAQSLISEDSLLQVYELAIQKEDQAGALNALNQLISTYPSSTLSATFYFARGTIRADLKQYESAILDFGESIKRDSTFISAYLQRAGTYYLSGKKEEALRDIQLAKRASPDNGKVDAALALLYVEESKTDEACRCMETSLLKGFLPAATFLSEKCNPESEVMRKFNLQILTDKSSDPDYGYSPEKPIKVGGNVTRQRAYLALLRNKKGKPIKYSRKGSCCPYPSENGFLGMAMIDQYLIKRDGKSKILYITFYDYEQPKIPVGFFSDQDFQK